MAKILVTGGKTEMRGWHNFLLGFIVGGIIIGFSVGALMCGEGLIEGNAYVTLIYDYSDATFWRVECGGRFSDIQGEYAIPANYAAAINFTEGWWHVIIMGKTIIYAEKGGG
jgi:hypothetical protein